MSELLKAINEVTRKVPGVKFYSDCAIEVQGYGDDSIYCSDYSIDYPNFTVEFCTNRSRVPEKKKDIEELLECMQKLIDALRKEEKED